MRLHFITAAVIAAICAGPVSADRVIFAPTGTTLAPGQIKAEAAIATADSSNRVYWAGIGLKRIEVNAFRVEGTPTLAGARNDTVVGAEFSLLPETTLTPGLGLGIWDIANTTQEGRGYYAALTKAVPLTKQLPLPIRDIRLHVGYGINGVDGAFVGGEAKLPLGFSVSAERFLSQTNASLGLSIIPTLTIKASVLDGDTFYGLLFNSPL